jgi:hypothetical protein
MLERDELVFFSLFFFEWRKLRGYLAQFCWDLYWISLFTLDGRWWSQLISQTLSYRAILFFCDCQLTTIELFQLFVLDLIIWNDEVLVQGRFLMIRYENIIELHLIRRSYLICLEIRFQWSGFRHCMACKLAQSVNGLFTNINWLPRL